MKKVATGIAIVAFAVFNLMAFTAENAPDNKAHRTKHAHVKALKPYPSLERFRSMDFIGPYPGDYAARKAAGDCVIDLGYGRSMSCDMGGGGHMN